MYKLEIVVAPFSPLLWLLDKISFVEITKKERLEFYD